MKKRAKIIAIVSTLCLCLSLFVVGVLAVSTASLSVTSSLSFKSNGAYVMVDGQLKQGATKESATLQSGAPATYTYKGYSYNCIGGTGADKDKPDGTASLENFVDASGEPNATWAIGEINFTSELPVAVYHFTFTNYSAMMVFVSVSSNIQELNTELAGKVGITESFESGNTIDAYDGTTAKTIVYTITVEITDYTTSFEDKQLELTINFSTDLPDQSDYFTYSGTTITGLSEKYFEDNPSVLIVPAYSESGQNLTIASGTYSFETYVYIGTFNGLVSPTVILQEGLTSVPSHAFYGCSSLSSISLPESVTSIGSGAFRYCSSLSSIILPEGVKSIGDSAFRDCSSLSSVTFGDNSQLTSIGSWAFYGCSSLSSINIPEGVTSIDGAAFRDCSSLSSVTFGDNSQLTSIGNYPFQNCSSLSSITIPEGVKSIGDQAFDGCSSLSSITIPEGVTSIGSYAFSNCYSLVEIYNYSSLTLNGSSIVGYLGQYALYVYNAKDGTEPEPTKISVDGNVQYYTDDTDIIAIGTYGNRNAINEITFKDDTTKINNRAFANCYALTSVTLPSRVTSIGTSAFSSCYALAEVYNYSTLNVSSKFSYAKVIHNLEVGAEKPATKILKEDGMQYYDNGNGKYIALSPIDRSSIKEVNIKSGTTEINQYAFYYCDNLTSVSLPNSVTSIGSYAFSGCSSLSSINIPDGVTSIGSYAFSDCSNLTSIDMTNVVDWNNLTLGSSSFNTTASTSAPTVITISSNADIQTVISKLTSSVIGSSMTNKIKLTNGTTNYVWNGSGWDLQTA